MPPRRHVPIRTCVLCGKKRPKQEMIRIVRSTAGEIRFDDARLNGRGCYICPDASALDARRINDKIRRALKFKGTVPAELIEQIKARINSN